MCSSLEPRLFQFCDPVSEEQKPPKGPRGRRRWTTRGVWSGCSPPAASPASNRGVGSVLESSVVLRFNEIRFIFGTIFLAVLCKGFHISEPDTVAFELSRLLQVLFTVQSMALFGLTWDFFSPAKRSGEVSVALRINILSLRVQLPPPGVGAPRCPHAALPKLCPRPDPCQQMIFPPGRSLFS